MPAGRPTKYKKEYCEMLVEFMGRPMPYEAFAGLIGVSFDVLYDWEKKHPEFLQAKKEGRAKMLYALTDMYWKGTRGELTVNRETDELKMDPSQKDAKGNPIVKSWMKKKNNVDGFNTTAMIFAMKNMAGWKDKIEITEDERVDEVEFED